MRFVPSELLQETVTRPDSTQLQTGFSGVFPFAASARTVKKPLPVFTPAGCKDYRNARQAQQLIALASLLLCLCREARPGWRLLLLN